MSESARLYCHTGARRVEREELEQVAVPAPTRTWFPLAHATVLDRVTGQLQEAGFAVRKTSLALSRDDARFFGTLDLDAPLAGGVSLAVGIRNSIDRSLPIGFAAGSRVFVCDNLAFSADVVVRRKHTRYGAARFEEALSQAVRALAPFREAEAARIVRMQAMPLSDCDAESLLLRAFEAKLLSHLTLPVAIQEWRTPSFEEFSDRTVWRLYNAVTFALAGRARTNPQAHAAATIKLGGLLLGRDAAEPVLAQAV